MFKIDKVNVYGLEESVRASKYPMSVNIEKTNSEITNTVKSLALTPKGEGHDQFLTGITVQFDLRCSNKMWVEAERYRFIFFVSSQSTMHRITKFDLDDQYNTYVDPRIVEIMKEKVKLYNEDPTPEKYLEILYSNPAGFEITARLTTNYRELKTVYSQRKTHRLPEWRQFCEWVETLPYAKELIIGGENTDGQ